MSLLRESIKYSKNPRRILPRLKDKIILPINYILAKLIAKLGKSKSLRTEGKPVLLFGAFGGRRYDDNSAALFEYMVRNEPDFDPYWIIRKDAFIDPGNERRIPFEDRVVFKDTLRACMLAGQAAAYIYTHGRYDITEYKKSSTPQALDVMLDHGFTSLKRAKTLRSPSGNDFVQDAADWDLIISGSEEEAMIHSSFWGVPKEKTAVAGLARYDRLDSLKNGARANGLSILYMPTWREWNASKISLAKTDFFRQIKSFLVDSSLDEYLHEKGITLNIYVHMWMRDFFEDFKNNFTLKSTNIIDLGADLQRVLVESSLLITDYSSISWDFLYLDKPVLFYQFDIDKYTENTGAYINMKEDLFGPISYDPEEAARWVRCFIENDYSTELFRCKMQKSSQYAFAYSDGKNCARISAAIKDKLISRKTGRAI